MSKQHLEGLLVVDDLADLPDGEGVVDVHLVERPLRQEEEGGLLPVIVPAIGVTTPDQLCTLKQVSRKGVLFNSVVTLD